MNAGGRYARRPASRTAVPFVVLLGSEFNRSPVGHEFPDFVHFFIRHCDTPVGPVPCSVSRAHPSVAVWQAMNHDVATGRDSASRRSLFVLLIRIGNVNRLVELALRVAVVEDVTTLRSLVISLPLFGANRRASESHFVRTQNLAVRKQSQSALALHDDHLVSLRHACLRGQHPDEQQ